MQIMIYNSIAFRCVFLAEPDVSTYQYEETSGYYYDPQTGLYYDANSQVSGYLMLQYNQSQNTCSRVVPKYKRTLSQHNVIEYTRSNMHFWYSHMLYMSKHGGRWHVPNKNVYVSWFHHVLLTVSWTKGKSMWIKLNKILHWRNIST